MEYSGSDAARDCISERSQCSGYSPELEHRLLYQELGRIGLGHNTEMSTGGGITVQRLILAEVVTVFVGTLLVLSVCGFQHEPYLILWDVLGIASQWSRP